MRSDFAPYIGTQLFREPCSQLCKRDISFLENWLTRFHSLITQPQDKDKGTKQGRLVEGNATLEVGVGLWLLNRPSLQSSYSH